MHKSKSDKFDIKSKNSSSSNSVDSFEYHITNTTELLLDKDKIFNKVDGTRRKTKIICSLG